MSQGIIVGCDRNQEWLLSWWWRHYSQNNAYPVLFVDFGMTEQARSWCQAHGELRELPSEEERELHLDTAAAAAWQHIYGDWFWSCRSGWFKKPLAMALSPFKRSLWMDLDCEVVGSLEPLMNAGPLKGKIALALDQVSEKSQQAQSLLLFGEVPYNSGVILFDRGCSLIEEWVKACKANRAHLRGDQEVLSRLIFETKAPVDTLPQLYNWSPRYGGIHFDARIFHWYGPSGKAAIRSLGGLSETIKNLGFAKGSL